MSHPQNEPWAWCYSSDFFEVETIRNKERLAIGNLAKKDEYEISWRASDGYGISWHRWPRIETDISHMSTSSTMGITWLETVDPPSCACLHHTNTTKWTECLTAFQSPRCRFHWSSGGKLCSTHLLQKNIIIYIKWKHVNEM